MLKESNEVLICGLHCRPQYNQLTPGAGAVLLSIMLEHNHVQSFLSVCPWSRVLLLFRDFFSYLPWEQMLISSSLDTNPLKWKDGNNEIFGFLLHVTLACSCFFVWSCWYLLIRPLQKSERIKKKGHITLLILKLLIGQNCKSPIWQINNPLQQGQQTSLPPKQLHSHHQDHDTVSGLAEQKNKKNKNQNNVTLARRPSLFSESLFRETGAADGLLRDRRPRDSRYQRRVHAGSTVSLSVESCWQHASGDQRAPLPLPHEWLMFSILSVF